MRFRGASSQFGFISFSFLLSALSGCSSSSGESPSSGPENNDSGSVATNEGGAAVNNEGGTATANDAGDAGTPSSGDGAAAFTAGAQGQSVASLISSEGAGCTLASQVDTNLTLSPATCAVYDAPNGLTVGATGGPVLTIEAGVTVAFGPGTQLSVGGSALSGGLVVQGTTGNPVVFTSDGATPKAGDWGGVDLQSQTLTTSSISGLIVQYGGNSVNAGPLEVYSASASFLFDGSNGDFTVPLSNVTVSNNAATAIAFWGQHTGPGSSSSGTLLVTDWATDADPFFVFPDAVALLSTVTVSTGSTAGGYVDVVEPGVVPNVVDVTETWPSIAPLSYVLGETTYGAVELDITAPGAQTTILTIDAPNTLRFGGSFDLKVDPQGTGLAGLHATGTSAAPITFTCIPSSPQPGSWDGIEFDYGTLNNNSSLDDVTIDSAGGFTSPATGALLLQGTDEGACVPGPTLSGVIFTNLPAGAYGILATDVTSTTANTYSTTNTFPAGSSGVYTPGPNNECVGF